MGCPEILGSVYFIGWIRLIMWIEHDSRKLYKIGINFSTQTRRMDR